MTKWFSHCSSAIALSLFLTSFYLPLDLFAYMQAAVAANRHGAFVRSHFEYIFAYVCVFFCFVNLYFLSIFVSVFSFLFCSL